MDLHCSSYCWYWTITPYNRTDFVWFVRADGTADGTFVDSNGKVHPVVYLNANIKLNFE